MQVLYLLLLFAFSAYMLISAFARDAVFALPLRFLQSF